MVLALKVTTSQNAKSSPARTVNLRGGTRVRWQCRFFCRTPGDYRWHPAPQDWRWGWTRGVDGLCPGRRLPGCTFGRPHSQVPLPAWGYPGSVWYRRNRWRISWLTISDWYSEWVTEVWHWLDKKNKLGSHSTSIEERQRRKKWNNNNNYITVSTGTYYPPRLSRTCCLGSGRGCRWRCRWPPSHGLWHGRRRWLRWAPRSPAPRSSPFPRRTRARCHSRRICSRSPV